jgi:hypothetical protein
MDYMFQNASAFDQNLGSWNVTSLTNAWEMFEGVALSTANYDALLIGWDAQELQSGVLFDGGNSHYCSQAAIDARENMELNDGWTIYDAGQACPLNAPTLVSPDDGSSTYYGIYPTFEWNAVTEATSYTIEYSLDDTFAAPNTADTSETSYTHSFDLAIGTWYWRVKAANAAAESEWSSVWSYTILPLDTPTLVSPDNGYNTLSTYPTFEWSEITGATTYHLELSQDETGFTDPVSTTCANTSCASHKLFPGIWYWRVNAGNYYQNSDWSSVRSIIIDDPGSETLDAPTLTAPTDGTKTTNTYPSFQWDAVSNATRYYFEISHNAEFNGPQGYDLENITSFTLAHELLPGTYYWRVSAYNDYLVSGWSEEWSITVQQEGPIILGPIDGRELEDHTPDFDWDDIPGATAYVIQISPREDFSILPIVRTVTNSFYAPGIAIINQQYWWRVTAIVDGMLTGWSEVRTITITGSPGNEAPVALSPEDGETTDNHTPTFDWTDVPTAVRYRIQMSKTPDFAVWLVNQTVTESEFTPGIWMNSGTYYWRVQAEGGGDSSWFSVKREIIITD